MGTTPAAQRVMVFRRLALDRVNRALRTLDGAAGKSINVAKVLHVLGAQVVATGFFGGLRGQQLDTLLRTRGLELDFVQVTTPTRECVTVIDESAGTITELVEESQPVSPDNYDKLLAVIRKHARQSRALVMSGTIASGGPSDLYYRCIKIAQEFGVLTMVDASGPALFEALKAGPDLVKPNRAELESTLARPLPDENALVMAMQELHGLGARSIAVTSGANPTLVSENGHFWRVANPKVPAVNPIGSGDAFTAGLVWALVRGETMARASRWAAAAGAANALTAMAGEVVREDVARLFEDVQVVDVGRV